LSRQEDEKRQGKRNSRGFKNVSEQEGAEIVTFTGKTTGSPGSSAGGMTAPSMPPKTGAWSSNPGEPGSPFSSPQFLSWATQQDTIWAFCAHPSFHIPTLFNQMHSAEVAAMVSTHLGVCEPSKAGRPSRVRLDSQPSTLAEHREYVSVCNHRRSSPYTMDGVQILQGKQFFAGPSAPLFPHHALAKPWPTIAGVAGENAGILGDERRSFLRERDRGSGWPLAPRPGDPTMVFALLPRVWEVAFSHLQQRGCPR
jgi:hypothetical protein